MISPFVAGALFIFVFAMGLYALALYQQRHKNDDK